MQSQPPPAAIVHARTDGDMAAELRKHMNEFGKGARRPSRLGKSMSVRSMQDLTGTKESLMVFRSLVRQYQGMSAQYGDTNFGEKLVGSKLRHGAMFIKHHVRKGVAVRWVWCSDDLKLLHWGTVNKKSERQSSGFVLISQITGVFPGFACPTSIPFKKAPSTVVENRCFTIQTEARTLDLECTSPHDRDLWIIAFRHLLKIIGKHGGEAELERVASDSNMVTNDPAADYNSGSSRSIVSGSGGSGNEMDPNTMSREMLIDEVVLLREAAKHTVSNDEVAELKQDLTKLQLDWLSRHAEQEARLREENEKLKARVEILLNHAKGSGPTDLTQMSHVEDGVSATIADVKKFFGPSSRSPSKPHLNSSGGGGGDNDARFIQVTNKLTNLERLLRETEHRVTHEKRRTMACIRKCDSMEQELISTKKLVAFVIRGLSTPKRGEAVLRTEEELVEEMKEAGGYLAREAQTLEELHMVNKLSIDDIAATITDQQLNYMDHMRLDGFGGGGGGGCGGGGGHGLSEYEHDLGGGGGYAPSLMAESMASTTTAYRQAVGVADPSKQLVLASMDPLGGDTMTVIEDVDDDMAMVPSSSSPAYDSRQRLSNLFRSLKAQWSLAVRMESAADIGMPKWIPDREAPRCMLCEDEFTLVRRRHHCRMCGGVYCGRCTSQRCDMEKFMLKDVRVCSTCFSIDRALHGGGGGGGDTGIVTRPMIEEI